WPTNPGISGRAGALQHAAALLLVGLQALAPTTRGFAHLLPPLHRRLHVVATPLELTEDALRGHFALQMLDRALDALVTDLDLERLARHGFTGIRQGTAHLTQSGPRGKPLRERT